VRSVLSHSRTNIIRRVYRHSQVVRAVQALWQPSSMSSAPRCYNSRSHPHSRSAHCQYSCCFSLINCCLRRFLTTTALYRYPAQLLRKDELYCRLELLNLERCCLMYPSAVDPEVRLASCSNLSCTVPDQSRSQSHYLVLRCTFQRTRSLRALSSLLPSK